MAVHAGHGPRLVRAAPPEHLIALGMAGQASRISFLDRRVGILGEADRNRVLAAPGLHVGLARSVTSFAAKLLQRSFGMRHGVAHDGVNKTLLLVGMAGHANLGADVIALGLGRRLWRRMEALRSAGLPLSCAALRETVMAAAHASAKINRIRRNDLMASSFSLFRNWDVPQMKSVAWFSIRQRRLMARTGTTAPRHSLRYRLPGRVIDQKD